MKNPIALPPNLSALSPEELRDLVREIHAKATSLASTNELNLAALSQARGRSETNVTYSPSPIHRPIGKKANGEPLYAPCWHARAFSYYYDDAGKRRTRASWRSLGTSDEAEACKELARLHREAGQIAKDKKGKPRPVARNLSDVLVEYIAFRIDENKNDDRSMERYRNAVDALMAYKKNPSDKEGIGDKVISSYTATEIKAAIQKAKSLRDGKGEVSPRTKLYWYKALRAIFAYAAAKGYRADNPIAKNAAAGEPNFGAHRAIQRIAATEEQARQILAYARADTARPWLADAIIVMALTLLRPINLCRLKWSYVKLADETNSVILKDGIIDRKNKNQDPGRPFVFPVTPEVYRILKRRQAEAQLLCGGKDANINDKPVFWKTTATDPMAQLDRQDDISDPVNRNIIDRRMGLKRPRNSYESFSVYSLRNFFMQLFEGKASDRLYSNLAGHSTTIRNYESRMVNDQRKHIGEFPVLSTDPEPTQGHAAAAGENGE